MASTVVQGAGLSVDNAEAIGALSDSAITEVDLMAGRWDAADVRLWDVDWQDTDQRQLIFRGQLGEITRTGAAFRAELRGLSEPLNRPMGRVYHQRCSAALGDGQCRFAQQTPEFVSEALIVRSDEGQQLFLAGAEVQDAGWFAHGQLVVLSGPAQGLSAKIKNDRQGATGLREVELWTGLGHALEVGDRVRLLAGCDKRPETCRSKFRNYLNFRGFPHLPSEDWLMAPQAQR